jgi:hypothetical protein
MTQHRAWYPLCFIAASLSLLIIFLPLSRPGMFIDGVVYAAIAKNLSLGHGSLWHPFYSQTLFADFHEHPPLAFYFQSLFFKYLGQGFGVEQVYCFFMALGQLALMAFYWLKQARSSHEEHTSILSLSLLLLFWLCIPLNHLYSSNHLEATLSLFTTLASVLLLIDVKTRLKTLLCLIGGAFAILIAFLCNGPTAFFPLLIPFLKDSLLHQQSKKGLKKSVLLGMLCASFFVLFFHCVPAALENIQQYLNSQLFPSVLGVRQLEFTGFKHLHIVILFLRAYAPITLIALLILYLHTKMFHRPFWPGLKEQSQDKTFQCFFALALISSLPVGLSHRQAFNYIMQSAPFYCLAMMYFCFEPLKKILASIATQTRIFKPLFHLSYIVFAMALMSFIYLRHGFNRDKDIFHDIQSIARYCEPNAIIGTSDQIYNQWYTGAYLARYAMLSLTTKPQQQYYLALRTSPLPRHYSDLKLPLSHYILARHDEAPLSD